MVPLPWLGPGHQALWQVSDSRAVVGILARCSEVPSSGCEPRNRVYQPTGCLFFHRLFKSHQHYQRNQVCSWPPGRRVREALTSCSCAFGGWGNILHEFPRHQTQGDHTVMTYKGKPALQQQLCVCGPVVDVKNTGEETV